MLDPLFKGNRNGAWKQCVEDSLKIHAASKERRPRKSVHWKIVKDAMAHIWKSLIADSKKTIDEHLDLIFDDLLAQCGSRLWRSREASCLARVDLLQGRLYDQVDPELAMAEADKVEDDEDLRKKLWLMVAKHVIVQEKGTKRENIRKAIAFLKETDGLLKIEDILPFFPDFVLIDDFQFKIKDYKKKDIDAMRTEWAETVQEFMYA